MTPTELLTIVGNDLDRYKRIARSVARETGFDPDDLFSETLLSLAGRKTLRVTGSDLGGLFRVAARQTLINLAVKRRRDHARIERFLALHGGPTRFYTVDDHADEVTFTWTLAHALGRISREYRQVILLVDVEGQQTATAAEILGIPQGTVLSRLSRGRAALRAVLADRVAA